MKLRPVVLVLLLLAGFYYVTTHLAVIGRHALGTRQLAAGSGVSPYGGSSMIYVNGDCTGPPDSFDLTEAAAAPAFDTEEQQNIAVYKKALPSVVNITSTTVQFDFFYGPVPQQGQGSGFRAGQARV